jgi:hypothetical protein
MIVTGFSRFPEGNISAHGLFMTNCHEQSQDMTPLLPSDLFMRTIVCLHAKSHLLSLDRLRHSANVCHDPIGLVV